MIFRVAAVNYERNYRSSEKLESTSNSLQKCIIMYVSSPHSLCAFYSVLLAYLAAAVVVVVGVVVVVVVVVVVIVVVIKLKLYSIVFQSKIVNASYFTEVRMRRDFLIPYLRRVSGLIGGDGQPKSAKSF